MGRAIHDANAITTLIGVSSTDGETPLAAELTAATNRLRVDAIITSGPPAEYTEGDTDATISGGVLMFEGGGDTIYATSDIHPLPVDCTEVEDVDDDGIAISQVLPLKIVENYVMSKTDGTWIRQQGSTEGYIFTRPIGIFDTDGHQWDINTSGQGETAPYGEYDRYAQDASTEAATIIEYEHHEIHAGSSFAVHIDNTTLSSDDDRTFVGFETPSGAKWLHLIIQGSASSAAEAFLVEDVTIDDDEGTQVVALDRNRNTANTSVVMSLQATPTVGSATWMTEAQLALANFSYVTLLDHVQLVAGAGPKAIGGTARSSQEWMLKAGKKYGLFIQNIGASTNLHEIHLDWYEHTNKN